ncbi:MATE family efflux transporter [Clostridium thermosuccinogenes]|uniref:Probable multidrug resistance protein NorM n=1 Tax=Clostridium thermosuccinogenes TaxID=84032 RepID=A0A2K2FS52_9CLOT|nr:MATE family efflux transporter [Pseudoclostridium thermosuccinogenes]AUS97969.1 MATE family efflux transporter [Pseudoclostridium thermosuccinogenes]PNU00266.1 MATE family efflux transporter [Pseudoclostridium thermosuccinogenes]PNU01590.1 MATE family efflux transporter [Pseudoclostridium thermosuccinogenes]
MTKLMKLFAPRDMTEGAPWKRIVEFAVPMLIGNVAQQLYNTADSIVVGKYVGDNALAAVGSAFPILNLLLVLFVGIATGAGIMVSQYFGAKDREKLSRTIGVSITLTAVASIIIMIIGPLATRPMLELLNTPESIIGWCEEYLIIFFVGVAGFFYYNILSGVLRGLGDSLSALVFLLISTALNVGLDIWFVAGFNMGVAGVALATVLAQGISSVLCAIKLMRMKDIFDFNLKMMKPEKEYSVKLLKLGMPSGLTQAIFSLAMVAVQSLTNSFGEMVIACNVIVMRVDGFAMMPNFTFGSAMTTYAGQNIGAGLMDRVKKGTRDGVKIAVGVSAAITVIILLFGRYLMSIFTDTAELVDLSMHMMRILAVGYIAMAVTQSLAGVMRGLGDTMTPMWISLITTIVLRVPVAYGIAYFTRSEAYPTGRPESTFISLLVAWTFGAIITAIFFKKKYK